MDYTVKIGLVIGALVLLALLWAVWKFFATLFKYVLIGLVVAAIGVGLTLYRMQSPPRNPAIGKHAYLKENGKYLGVVETQGEDNQLGEVWVVRPPGGDTTTYAKSRVTLKDKLEPSVKQQNQPAQSPTPNAEKKPAATKAGKEKK